MSRLRIGWLLFLLLVTPHVWAFEIVGASTIQPVIEVIRPALEARHGSPISLQAGGSGAGVREAATGQKIGMVSRALTAEEKRNLLYFTIGFDALAIIVNRSNPIVGLSKSQISDIFSGRTDNWKTLAAQDSQVVRVTKEVGRSTLDLFEGYSGLVSPDRNTSDGRPVISSRSYTIGANSEALTLVGGMAGAIGYVSLGAAQAMISAGMPVKLVALDGVAPDAGSIVQGTYPIVRELNIVFRFESEEVRLLRDLLLGEAGQEAVRSAGFLGVR